MQMLKGLGIEEVRKEVGYRNVLAFTSKPINSNVFMVETVSKEKDERVLFLILFAEEQCLWAWFRIHPLWIHQIRIPDLS